MNSILYTKTLIIAFFYQIPLPGDGDTDIDAAPIDDYLIVGLIAGMLLIIFFKYIQKTSFINKISK